MRAFIEWRDEWLMHIADVDEEHQQLVRLLNRVAECYTCGVDPEEGCPPEGPDGEEMFRLLESLGDHARQHFKNEERCMIAEDYPDFDSHRYEHVTLLAEFAEMMRDMREKGMSCVDVQTLQALKEWLISHIVGADRKFADHYHISRGQID